MQRNGREGTSRLAVLPMARSMATGGHAPTGAAGASMAAPPARRPRGWSMMVTTAPGGSRDAIRRYLPDLVYGANDGVVTTLAVMAGVVGADLSARVILVLGFANLFADGLSMAASNVLSQRSRAEGRPTLRAAARNGAATFAGFVGAGLVPLLAYLAPLARTERFPAAAGLALATLFVVGAGRAYFTRRRWLQAGAEMLLIGAAAGGIAYAVGVLGARWLDGIGGSG
jgi:hypothetical protein